MKNWFLNLFGVLGEFMKAVLRRGIADQLNVILPLALETVARIAADPTGLTSSEKREAAIDLLGRQLVTRSIEASASTINFALELALQKYKAGE